MPVLDGDLDLLLETHRVLYMKHIAGLISVCVVLIDEDPFQKALSCIPHA